MARESTTQVAGSFDTTIPRQLVHKAGPEAVWLTSIEPVGEHRYVAAGHVPRAHSFINDALPPLHTYDDVSLLAELGRQAGIGSMHAFEGVPNDWATVFLKFDLELTDPQPNDPSPAPVPVVVTVDYTNRVRGDEGILSDVGASMTFEIDGQERATSRTLASAREKDGYRAWRDEVRAAKPLAGPGDPPLPEPVAAERVGRRNPDNVLIGELAATGEAAAFTCDVRVDRRHPHFFEHPMDHIPGVVHIEAGRQAALAAAAAVHGLEPAGAVVLESRSRFRGFAELERALTCSITVGAARPVGSQVDVPVELRFSQPGDNRVTDTSLVLRARQRG